MSLHEPKPRYCLPCLSPRATQRGPPTLWVRSRKWRPHPLPVCVPTEHHPDGHWSKPFVRGFQEQWGPPDRGMGLRLPSCPCKRPQSVFRTAVRGSMGPGQGRFRGQAAPCSHTWVHVLLLHTELLNNCEQKALLSFCTGPPARPTAGKVVLLKPLHYPAPSKALWQGFSLLFNHEGRSRKGGGQGAGAGPCRDTEGSGAMGGAGGSLSFGPVGGRGGGTEEDCGTPSRQP